MKEIDFESDLKEAIQNEYKHLGVKINNSQSLNDMLFDYLTVHFKLIQPICRSVIVSSILKQKLIGHPKENVVQIIKDRLERGLDVNLFQNKKLLQTNFHDHLLSEWHIYHFHLSIERDYKGRFFKKTNALLFAYIDDKRAILLDIENHKDGIFADEKWLEILDNEFPEILEPYVDKTIQAVFPELTPVDRQELWSKGITMGLTKVNGKIIHSPGIGRMTSGHSSDVARTSIHILRWVFSIKEQFSKYGERICELLGLTPSETKFRVKFGNPTLDVVDEITNTKILSFPETFQIIDKVE